MPSTASGLATSAIWSVTTCGGPISLSQCTRSTARYSKPTQPLFGRSRRIGTRLIFEYVRTHLHSLFWSDFLSCRCPPITLDFLLEEGVRERIRYIKEYYQRDDDEINAMIHQPRKYLHKEQMDAFIDTASTALLSLITNPPIREQSISRRCAFCSQPSPLLEKRRPVWGGTFL